MTDHDKDIEITSHNQITRLYIRRHPRLGGILNEYRPAA
jgi:hypothetical protein